MSFNPDEAKISFDGGDSWHDIGDVHGFAGDLQREYDRAPFPNPETDYYVTLEVQGFKRNPAPIPGWPGWSVFKETLENHYPLHSWVSVDKWRCAEEVCRYQHTPDEPSAHPITDGHECEGCGREFCGRHLFYGPGHEGSKCLECIDGYSWSEMVRKENE